MDLQAFSYDAFCAHMRRVLQGSDTLEDQIQGLVDRLGRCGAGRGGAELPARLAGLQEAFNGKLARLRELQRRLAADKAGIDVAQSAEMAALLGQRQKCERARALLGLKRRLYENYERVASRRPASAGELPEPERRQLFDDFQAIGTHGLLGRGVARLDAIHAAYVGLILRYFTHNQINAQTLRALAETPGVCQAYLAAWPAPAPADFACVARRAVLFCRGSPEAAAALADYAAAYTGRQRPDYEQLCQDNETLAFLSAALNSAPLAEATLAFNVAALARTKFAPQAVRSARALAGAPPLRLPGEPEVFVYLVLRMVQGDSRVGGRLSQPYLAGLAQRLREQAGLARVVCIGGRKQSLCEFLDGVYAPGVPSLDASDGGLRALVDLQNAARLADGATQQLLDGLLDAVILSQLLGDARTLRTQVSRPAADQQSDQLPALLTSLGRSIEECRGCVNAATGRRWMDVLRDKALQLWEGAVGPGHCDLAVLR